MWKLALCAAVVAFNASGPTQAADTSTDGPSQKATLAFMNEHNPRIPQANGNEIEYAAFNVKNGSLYWSWIVFGEHEVKRRVEISAELTNVKSPIQWEKNGEMIIRCISNKNCITLDGIPVVITSIVFPDPNFGQRFAKAFSHLIVLNGGRPVKEPF